MRGPDVAWINISVGTSCVLTVLAYLYLHGFGLHHIDLVLVAAPDLVVHDSHAADGVVGFPQVQQVEVDQVPLSI